MNVRDTSALLFRNDTVAARKREEKSQESVWGKRSEADAPVARCGKYKRIVRLL